MAKRRRLKKSVKKKLKQGCGASAALLSWLTLRPYIVHAAGIQVQQNSLLAEEVPVYTVKNYSATSVTDQIAETIIGDGSNVDETSADINVYGLKSTQPGFQKVTISGTVAESNEYVTKEAIVYVDNNQKAPVLRLKKKEVTIDNDGAHVFVPESYIQRISDASGVLPALKIEGSVDVTKDDVYNIKYTAVNQSGESTVATLLVKVETPEWLIKQRAEEAAEAARKQAEEEARAKAEAEEQARKQRLEEEARLLAEQSTTSGLNYSGGSNPYSGGWSNCTYGAWQALYNATGIALPGMGNAGGWLSSAASMGYATGTTPQAGTIAVYSHHVAYVDSVSGDMVHIVEGGFNGHYNERWVSASGTGSQALRGYIYVS